MSDEVARLRAEVRHLREALAYEARVIEAHAGFDTKSMSKSRRLHIQGAIDRMREAAISGVDPAASHRRWFEDELEKLEAGA